MYFIGYWDDRLDESTKISTDTDALKPLFYLILILKFDIGCSLN